MSSLKSRMTAWSAGLQSHPHHVLFDASSQSAFSHVFTVDNHATVLAAYGLAAADRIEVDMVSATPSGDVYEPIMLANGKIQALTATRNVVPIPFEGRIRLRVVTGTPGAFRVIATPTVIPQEFWEALADAEITIASADGSLVVTHTPGTSDFDLSVDPVNIASIMAMDAGAMTTLSNQLLANGVTLTGVVSSDPHLTVTNVGTVQAPVYDLTHTLPANASHPFYFETPPASPELGWMWRDGTGRLYMWQTVGTGQAWVDVSGLATLETNIPPVHSDTTAPLAAVSGQLWFDEAANQMKVWVVTSLGSSFWYAF